ncbi:MAG: cyclomaltodextrinase N-terminal domain-containing protein, partial [Bacteroidota bacterium]|nr:cyclomaltodextrinase N-terminal domain-containing protein [Bacteroidota bacterium]
MKKIFVFVIYCILSFTGFSQDIKVYPSNWWVGMKNSKLQLMIHGDENITMDKLVFRSSSPDVKVIKVYKPENRHYLFVDLRVASTAKPQKVKFSFGGVIANEWKNLDYEFKALSKEDGKTRTQGITSKDFLYLMIPDRFSNGDPSNDVVAGYRDQTSDRTNMFSRHGGDFKGIENH